MKFLTKINTIFDRTINFLAVLAGVLLSIITGWVCVEVFMRYVLNKPTKWVLPISEISLLYITFLVTTWVLKKEGHVKVDTVLNRLNPRTQNLVNGITSMLCAIGCLALTRYSIQTTWNNFQAGYLYTTILPIPYYSVLVIIPVGSFLLAIQFLRRTYGFLRAETKNKH